ncbi:MAG TPA: CBS domain-containing protein [Gaiellaceae bacterium]|nr:CBS domain-containing protein [Gaiellaceae bacterium]
MKVNEVMTREVTTVTTDVPLKEAAALLSARRISGLPVIDSARRVVGVLSEGDILYKELGGPREKGWLERLIEFPVPEDGKAAATTVGEAMSAPAITILPTRPVSEAARTMIEEGVKRLPVVDVDGILVGIVTRADLVRAFIRSDEDIAEEIREQVILRTLWLAPEQVTVTVDHGEVRLAGQVETKTDAELLPAFVQRVPGVVTVLSKLTWPPENGHHAPTALLGAKKPGA